MALKVLIADDETLVSDALAAHLEGQDGLDVLTTDSFAGVLAVIAAGEAIDLLLLKIKLPGLAGLAHIETLVSQAPNAKIVLFGGEVQRQFLIGAIEVGCRGFISKSMPLKSLVSVFDLVMSGQVFVPTGSGRSAAAAEDDGAALSEQEAFVLKRAADGMTNKEIARDMSSTEVLVKMHMRTLCKKLGARNRAHAAMISRDLALI